MHMVNIIIYTLDYAIKIIQVYATPKKVVNNKIFAIHNISIILLLQIITMQTIHSIVSFINIILTIVVSVLCILLLNVQCKHYKLNLRTYYKTNTTICIK
jgi:hypothetical protein